MEEPFYKDFEELHPISVESRYREAMNCGSLDDESSIINLINSKNFEDYSEQEKHLVMDYIAINGYVYFVMNIESLSSEEFSFLVQMSKKYFSVEFYLMIPFLLEHYTSSNAIFNLLISILLQNNKILDYSTLAEICLHEIIVNQKCLLIKKIIDEIPSEFLKDILHFLENESEKFFHSEVLQNILFLILKIILFKTMMVLN